MPYRFALSFRLRTILIVCALVVVSQVTSLFFFDYIMTQHSRRLISDELEAKTSYFKNILDRHADHLAKSTNLLVYDFAFKRAIATLESKTVRFALYNQKERLDADIIALVGSDRKFFVSTINKEQDGKSKNLSNLLAPMTDEGKQEFKGRIIEFEGKMYLINMAPVKTPETIAYLLTGLTIDKDLAQQMKKWVNADVTFAGIRETPKTSEIATFVSSDPDIKRPVLLAKLNSDLRSENTFGQKNRVLSKVVPVYQNGGLNVVAVLTKSWEQLFEKYTRYRPWLSVLTLFLILISIPLAIYLAYKVTRPVHRLVNASQRVAAGDYSTRVEIGQSDELGKLGDHFNHMVKALEEHDRVRFLAFHDTLTKLPNRRMLKAEIDDALARHQGKGIASSLLLIDLDNFKPVNDTYGHEAGDQVLQEIADRMRHVFGEDDEILARLGGDELAVLLHEQYDKEKVMKKADSLRQALNNPILLSNGKTVQLGCSIGVSISDASYDTSEWLRNADTACYAAKSAGKNQVNFA